MSYQYETSLPAYKEVLPKINEKQRRVLEAMKQLKFHSNDREIASCLSWPINCVTPRRLELLQKGFIYEFGKFPDRVTGRKTSFWKVKEQQLTIF